MAETKITTTDKQILPVMTGKVKTKNDSLQTVRGYLASTQVPASPIVHDILGGNISTLIFETKGAARVEVWRSKNSDNPVNQSQLDAGTTNVPDYSNIKWKYIDTLLFSDEGTKDLPLSLLQDLSRSRYVKFDKTHGADINISYAHSK